jgi:hypothetical protein
MRSLRRKVRERGTSARTPESGRIFSTLAFGRWRTISNCNRTKEQKRGKENLRIPGPSGGRAHVRVLTFDQSNVASAGTLCRFLCCEFHALPLPQQFEDRAAHGAAVKEVFDAALIAYESKSLIDEETCNSPGRHSRVLRCA